MSNYSTDFESPLFERDQGLKYRRERVLGAQKKLRQTIDQMHDLMRRIHKMQDQYDAAVHALEAEVPNAMRRERKRLEALIKKLEWENKKLTKELKNRGQVPVESANKADVDRAKTIAIFDGILFAIENWSTDGQLAADFVIACQSILFPVIYDKVMGGDEDYYLTKVPVSALEVVSRGREYVKYFRQEIDEGLTTDTAWPIACDEVHDWCLNDFLPLLYGARAEDWDKSDAYSLAQMLQWRDQPQARILDFPRIQDAMDLVKEHGDIIRESTGLPEFTKQTQHTRIEL